MSTTPSDATMQHFLQTYLVGNRTLTNIAAVDELLPAEPEELRALATHATEAALEATQHGYHVEARRLAELARQLTKRAMKAEESRKDHPDGT